MVGQGFNGHIPMGTHQVHDPSLLGMLRQVPVHRSLNRRTVVLRTLLEKIIAVAHFSRPILKTNSILETMIASEKLSPENIR
jgi:hypothetical protein